MNTTPINVPLPPVDDEDQDSGIIDFSGLRNDIGYALHAPFRRKRLALACFALVMVLAAFSSLVFRDVYQVQASILALRNPVMLTLSNPNLARGNDWDAPTRAARETVTRRDNLIALCQQTRFVERHLASRSVLGKLRARLTATLTGREEASDGILQALADSLETKLWVNVGSEGTVTIIFEWPDKEIAYLIVEAAVQNFLEARHASEVAVLGDTISLLEASAAKLQREVDATLTDLERKERARPRSTQARVVPRVSAIHKDEDLARLQATLGGRKRALLDLEEFRQRRNAELTAQLAQKEAIYAAQHPEVLSLKQSIAALLQPSPPVEALRLEIKELEQEVKRRAGPGGADGGDPGGTMANDLIESRIGLDSDDVRYEYDRSGLRFMREQYASVLQRLSSARLELETAQAAFKYRYSVISPPTVPKTPKRPYTLLRILGGLLGGAALALFVTTAVDIRSGRVLEEWQVQRQLQLPVVGRLPR